MKKCGEHVNLTVAQIFSCFEPIEDIQYMSDDVILDKYERLLVAMHDAKEDGESLYGWKLMFNVIQYRDEIMERMKDNGKTSMEATLDRSQN